MPQKFQADCLPVLIGSLPLLDHFAAAELIMKSTPQIPLWAQLPNLSGEDMLTQFLDGMPGLENKPGLEIKNAKAIINTGMADFDNQLLDFYENYMAVIEGQKNIFNSRFSLSSKTAPGFFTLLDKIPQLSSVLKAVKGQITGPVTFCTALTDQDKRAVFYNEQVRDAAVKMLGLKAAWQIKKLAVAGCPVIIFIDEPALAGFGSSEFISITKEDIAACLNEVIEQIHQAGGLAGIHVCANTDWSLVMESEADIINFDAYSYFDKFYLYPDQIKNFMGAGRILAWGIVPTLRGEDIEKETVASLEASWIDKALQIEKLGIPMKILKSQSLITPSCGTGSLSLEHAKKVLILTNELSQRLQES